MSDTAESLACWLDWLYPDTAAPCRCEHEYKPLGRLHGVDMGKGWVRMTTHPYCVHHGDKAQAEQKRRHRITRIGRLG